MFIAAAYILLSSLLHLVLTCIVLFITAFPWLAIYVNESPYGLICAGGLH